MNDLHIDKADILGFSDGGNIALVFVLKYPKRVNKLILNSANLDPSGLIFSLRLSVSFGYFAAKIASIFSKSEAARAEMLALMAKQPHIKAVSLAEIEAKTLVIVGNKDLIKREHSELISQNIPNAKIQVIAGDHFIAQKQSNEFNLAVKEFLESN